MGVDSSTQSCKVVITRCRHRRDGARRGARRTPTAPRCDPGAWWTALRAAIADAGGLADVEAWAIGGQQHGMVALDADGHVIRDALLWNDTRSAGAAADLIAEFGAEALAQRTGLVPVASFTITKLRWLRDHEPDNAARVAAVALPARLADLAPARLRARGRLRARARCSTSSSPTGRMPRAPATGTRHAAATTATCWSRRSGHDAILPRVLGPERVGRGRGRAPRRAAVPATTPARRSDSARGPGDVVVSIGTSGTVFAVSEQRTIDPTGTVAGFADCTGQVPAARGDAERRARARRDRRACSGSTTPSSAAWPWPQSPGARGLTLVPYFEGERTPNLPDATASLTGMTLASTTRENLARAAVEGMLSGLGAGLEALRALGVPSSGRC